MVNRASEAQVAAPTCLGQDFRDAAPGHRFYLYLPAWDAEWKKVSARIDALEELTRLSPDDRSRMAALAERQHAVAQTLAHRSSSDSAGMLSYPAMSSAPFTTGLGMAHPLENGFAFMSPYGLPYLPGSSVKGVLRQAARDLLAARVETDASMPGFSETDIVALFGGGSEKQSGMDGESEAAQRGALQCWDVYPVLADTANLRWDIMTPHQGAYYGDSSGKTPPHDNDPPVPINFLTLPPGTRFRFHLSCDTGILERRAPGLAQGGKWREVCTRLLEHAFDWLGFGAKTSLGYGAMAMDKRALEQESKALKADAEARAEAARIAELPPAERLAQEFLKRRTNTSVAEHSFLEAFIESPEVPAEHREAFVETILARLEKRRGEIMKLKDKKVRKQRLETLQKDEQRLRALRKPN